MGFESRVAVWMGDSVVGLCLRRFVLSVGIVGGFQRRFDQALGGGADSD